VRRVSVLLLALLICIASTAACSKSSNNTSSSESAAPASEAPATAGSMANAASAAPAALPIPLSKLPSATVAAGDVAAGAKVFEANCASCHGVGGKNGTVGPSLAGIGIKPGQVAYMVLNPAAVDKESGMPKLPLSAKEVADVAAYVASLK
jgi:mono/diheme cytochrome c family protein